MGWSRKPRTPHLVACAHCLLRKSKVIKGSRPSEAPRKQKRGQGGALWELKGELRLPAGHPLPRTRGKRKAEQEAPMESRPPRRWAPPAASWGPWLLGLLLFPWTLQLTGGQSVTHSGDPILVSLANKAVSFNCKITYSYTPEFKDFTVWYFHVDLKSQRSLNKQVNCPPTQGKENQTYTLQCQVTLKLPNASATGTYYCCVNWPNVHRISDGVFILVRDTGYRGPPQNSQKLLLLCFTGLLTALSILVTALLLWKKRQMQAPREHPALKDPARSAAARQEQPPEESVYTVLQRRDTEVYSCIQNEARSLPPTQNLLSQKKLNGFLDDSEFNLVYENL